MDIINQTYKLFFPQERIESKEITFNNAIESLQTQRIARIVKTIFFSLSSMAATTAIILTEAAAITWSIALPSILVTLVAGVIFYRLNSLDETYVAGLDETTRQLLAKKELERIFLGKMLTADEIKKSLYGINRLLEIEIYDQKMIDDILLIQKHATNNDKSLAELAIELNKPLTIALGSEWLDQGRFGLPSYNRNVAVTWTGLLSDPINVTYQAQMVVQNSLQKCEE